MNTRLKGQRNELKAVKESEADGWEVCKIKGSTRFNKEVDFFGLWDLMCLKRVHIINDHYRTYVRFIQVKTNQKRNTTKHKEFADKYPDLCCELWLYRDRKEKKIYGF